MPFKVNTSQTKTNELSNVLSHLDCSIQKYNFTKRQNLSEPILTQLPPPGFTEELFDLEPRNSEILQSQSPSNIYPVCQFLHPPPTPEIVPNASYIFLVLSPLPSGVTGQSQQDNAKDAHSCPQVSNYGAGQLKV